MLEKLLTANEVAEALNCHPQSVYRNKELPTIDIPGIGKRYDPEILADYVKALTTKRESLLSQVLESNSFRLTDLDEFDKLYLKSNKGGNSGSMKRKKTRWNYAFGSVYIRTTKQGKDRWYIDYKLNGKRKREVVENAQGRAEAVLHLKEKNIEAFNAIHNMVKVEPQIKFARLSESYIKDYAMQNKKTWKNDQSSIKANLDPHFGASKLKDITSLRIEKYKALRLMSGITKSSVNRELALLRKMFNLAIDWGYTSENPVTKVKFFSEKDNLKERILTTDEEALLLEKSPDYLKPILIFALNTGMRKGEILNLEWSRVDLENGLVKVENTKGGRTRYININTELSTLLSKMKSDNAEQEFVFSNPTTGKPYSDVKRSFMKACNEADISSLRFHDLRHTFASRLVESGADLITVKELLGHSTVKMTERYTHSNQTQKKNAVELLVNRAEKASRLAQICHTEQQEETQDAVNDSI